MSQARINDRRASLTIQGYSGIPVIPSPTPLTRLNYFDGKFLTAEDLRREQRGQRSLVELSNQAGGSGVVHGFNVVLSSDGDQFELGPGLAIDPEGRVLLLPQSTPVGIQELIDRSSLRPASTSAQLRTDGSGEFEECEVRAVSDPDSLQPGISFYLITIGHAEAYCGTEDVYGKLCEEACVSGTERPYILEGVVIRAVSLQLNTPLATSAAVALTQTHLRSLIASAYFADERRSDLISAAGLSSAAWCLGALPEGIQIVPIGLLARAGQTTLFLDAWTARRERIEPPPRKYWAWQMRMRPWNVFLAQILQFQCQLRHCLSTPGGGSDDDPCQEAHQTIDNAAQMMDDVIAYYAEVAGRFELMGDALRADSDAFRSHLNELKRIQASLQAAPSGSAGLRNRLLIGCGIVELPSAGYLPVVPGAKLSVNAQVRRMMGEGVDLRFCVVRSDYVAHALEEAQHMERISLLHGLDHPNEKPRVDVLVPDGEIEEQQSAPAGVGYEMSATLLPAALKLIQRWASPAAEPVPGIELLRQLMQPGLALKFDGAARGERSETGRRQFYFAGLFEIPQQPPAFTLIELLRHAALWTAFEIDRDPFEMDANQATRVNGEVTVLFHIQRQFILIRFRLGGDLQVKQPGLPSNGATTVLAQFSGLLNIVSKGFGAGPPRAIPISEDVILRRRDQDALNPAVEVILPSPDLMETARSLVAFQTVRSWNSATTAQVTGDLVPYKPIPPVSPGFTLVELPRTATGIPLYNASQSVNPDVLQPGHTAHESAVTALRLMATALADPQFDDIAIRKLFPPPAPQSSEFIIHARRDWVLFHRRRDKQCAYDQPPVVEVGVRKYRLYYVNLQSQDRLQEFIDALRANDGTTINNFEPEPVSVVQFAAGTQALDTPADQVRADWNADLDGPGEIAYAAVASRGNALDDGQALARARLSSLSNALESVTPIRDDALLEVIPNMPDASDITPLPHDGVMVVAVAPVATQCHVVYRVEESDFPAVRRIIQTGSATGIHDRIVSQGGQEVGQFGFQEGTDTLLSDPQDLKDAWQAQGDGKILGAITVSRRPDDPPTPEQSQRIELLKSQSATINAVLSGTPEFSQLFPEDQNELDRCPAITLLIVSAPEPPQTTVTHAVFVHNSPLTFEAIAKEITGAGLQPTHLKRRLDDVIFNTETNDPTPESLQRIAERWKKDFPNITREVQFFAVSRQSSTAEQQKRHQEQTAAIEKVTQPGSKVVPVVNGSAQFPTGDESLTLIVISDPIL